jgi:hypothetical protein
MNTKAETRWLFISIEFTCCVGWVAKVAGTTPKGMAHPM